MARVARVVVPGVPHHVTQRGNRRQRTFFGEGDYSQYRALVGEFCALHGVQILAYCLMPNHVHLVAVPARTDSLSRALGEAHRRYTLRVNEREGWKGYLWQGRFCSCPMDERHMVDAVRYVEQNPVRAGLVSQAWYWPWSSARPHVLGRDDSLVSVQPLLKSVGDWTEFLKAPAFDIELLRKHSATGRPLGGTVFIEECGKATGRDLRVRKVGRPPIRRGTINPPSSSDRDHPQ